jgi:hypothetical protein
MIFNEAAYYFLFLAPSVLLFHGASPAIKRWVPGISGVLFFIYFSGVHFGGLIGASAVVILLWEVLILKEVFSPISVVHFRNYSSLFHPHYF